MVKKLIFSGDFSGHTVYSQDNIYMKLVQVVEKFL